VAHAEHGCTGDLKVLSNPSVDDPENSERGKRIRNFKGVRAKAAIASGAVLLAGLGVAATASPAQAVKSDCDSGALCSWLNTSYVGASGQVWGNNTDLRQYDGARRVAQSAAGSVAASASEQNQGNDSTEGAMPITNQGVANRPARPPGRLD
jgi:hypothetical protein